MKRSKFDLYKIPGRQGAVPNSAWTSQDIKKLRPYLELQKENVVLPAVTSEHFPESFRKISGAFLDKNWKDFIANKSVWKAAGVWVICSLGQPCWVLIRK